MIETLLDAGKRCLGYTLSCVVYNTDTVDFIMNDVVGHDLLQGGPGGQQRA